MPQRPINPLALTKSIISPEGVDALKSAVKSLRVAAKDVSGRLKEERKPREVRIWEDFATEIEQQVIVYMAD